jgi:hypothetical protein
MTGRRQGRRPYPGQPGSSLQSFLVRSHVHEGVAVLDAADGLIVPIRVAGGREPASTPVGKNCMGQISMACSTSSPPPPRPVSANGRGTYNMAPARRDLGYVPKDDSERYAVGVLGQEAPGHLRPTGTS